MSEVNHNDELEVIGAGKGQTTLSTEDAEKAQVEMEEVKKLAEEAMKHRIPTREEIADQKRMRKESRLYWRVWNHCKNVGHTLKEEYDLILAKESDMPRACRDYLVAVMEYVPTDEQIAEVEARDIRIMGVSQEEE